MSFERYVEWLSRGRAHQSERRMIDALLCYRRALQEQPRGADAQFHIGEIAWHMGNPDDAVATWRTTSAASPSHVPSWHALADALAARGEFDASRDALARVLAARPNQPRARALQVLLDAMRDPDTVEEAALAHAATLRSWPLPLLAGVIARLLATPHPGRFEQAMPALLDAAQVASATRESEDALRRIALALAARGEADRARRFAERYGEACRALHRMSSPLLWPRRTAGDALRVGILHAAGDEARVASVQKVIDDAHLGEVRVERFEGPEAATTATADDGRVPPHAADSAARTVARHDLDLLIDLAGVHIAAGPMLAQHPARAVWAIESDAMPCVRALVDRDFQDDPASLSWELGAALRELKFAMATLPKSAASAQELATLWEEAMLAHRAGDVEAAHAAYARVLAVEPAYAPALYLTGVLARTRNDTAAACERFGAAVAAAPYYVDARVALATALIAANDAERAASVAREGLTLDELPAALWRALGQAELARGDATAAIEAFEQALQREAGDGETHYNHGVALQTASRLGDAARAYQRALVFRPELHAADFNLGAIFDQQGNAGAAIAAFSNVLARVPDHVAAYKALAETLLASGRIDAWFANFERFEQHCPDDLALAVHALEVSAYRADFPRIARYLDGLREGRYRTADPQATLDALQQLLYLLHFFDVEPDLIGRYARTHDTLATRIYGPPWPRRTERRLGRIRIGYLSGDFRNHVMGKMMLEALRHHDRERFDVFGYATTDARDAWTPQFEAVFARFVPLGTLPDDAAARRIADDDLDLLVDLSTHTKGARPGILARKPARVQVTHVASAGTLAMSAIDYKLTDRFADTTATPATSIEPLLAMEGCVYPYRHVAPAAETPYSRTSLGIPDGAVVIGAFSSPLKLSQRCLALWRDVLAAIPNAVLAVSPVHPALRGVFQRIADVAGIGARRLVFVPQGRDDAENQARYRMIDFVLDPMPYGGVNGTLEALDMGVPVVTLVGGRHAERTSYSILINLGVTETIAQTGGDYVAIAVRLATDAAFMRQVRETIARGLAQSPLVDMPAHTRHLEAAYLAALAARAPEALALGEAPAS
jgi:tetratricopeptide (TPR) repeat protein